MTQSSALSGLTPRKHGEEKEDDLERTARGVPSPADWDQESGIRSQS